MKRFALPFVLALALASPAAMAQNSEDTGVSAFPEDNVEPGPPSQSKRIDDLRQGAADIFEQLSRDPNISDILTILQENLKESEEVTKIIQETNDVDSVIDEVSTRFDQIADNFAQIAKISPRVFENRLLGIQSLEAIQREAALDTGDVHRRIREWRAKNRALENKIRSGELSNVELNNAKIDIRANDLVIKSLVASIEVWNSFAEQHEQLIDSINEHSGRLDNFLHALKRNADIYRSVAEIMRLRKSLAAVVGQLKSIQNLGEHIERMDKSWQELDKAIDKLRNEKFLKTVPSS